MLSHVAAAAKSLQSCPTLCDPIDSSPPGSAVPGILQARTVEWVAISFSNAWKGKGNVKSFSRVRPSATPWSEAYQAPPSMGFSRQEYWSGAPLPSPSHVASGNEKWSRHSHWLPLWKNCLETSCKIRYTPTIWPSNKTTDVYPSEMKTYIHAKTCMWAYITALFINVKNQKQRGCPLQLGNR